MPREDRRDVNPDTFTQIYISRLDRRTGESDIHRAFSKFGEIKQVTMKNFYAFVDFMEHSAAVDAVAEMNGQTFINGELLTV
jgi:RNA recognition motif-containing protein